MRISKNLALTNPLKGPFNLSLRLKIRLDACTEYIRHYPVRLIAQQHLEKSCRETRIVHGVFLERPPMPQIVDCGVNNGLCVKLLRHRCCVHGQTEHRQTIPLRPKGRCRTGVGEGGWALRHHRHVCGQFAQHKSRCKFEKVLPLGFVGGLLHLDGIQPAHECRRQLCIINVERASQVTSGCLDKTLKRHLEPSQTTHRNP